MKPYQVFIKEGIRIGVFGLGIELEGLVTKRLYGETKYLDPIEMARHISRTLKEEEKCHIIICLSHLGNDYPHAPNKVCDRSLAQQTENIHLIIGGHTHTFMDRPEIHHNRNGQEVIIHQVGCYGLRLGRIDFYLDADGNPQLQNSVSIQV